MSPDRNWNWILVMWYSHEAFRSMKRPKKSNTANRNLLSVFDKFGRLLRLTKSRELQGRRDSVEFRVKKWEQLLVQPVSGFDLKIALGLASKKFLPASQVNYRNYSQDWQHLLRLSFFCHSLHFHSLFPITLFYFPFSRYLGTTADWEFIEHDDIRTSYAMEERGNAFVSSP